MGFSQSWEALLPELEKAFRNLSFHFNFTSFAAFVAAYILMAMGLYTIARKRNIQNPWLAWIPVADLWLLGCISDQYHYVTKGEERKRRKWMLALGIIELVASPLIVFLTVVCAVGLVAALMTGSLEAMGAGVIVVAVMVVLCMVLCIGLTVVSIVLQVQRCYALYDLFCSCEIQNKTLYSVLSIVASCLGFGLIPAIFVFICREKEEGMPPRIAEQAE